MWDKIKSALNSPKGSRFAPAPATHGMAFCDCACVRVVHFQRIALNDSCTSESSVSETVSRERIQTRFGCWLDNSVRQVTLVVLSVALSYEIEARTGQQR